MPVESVIACVSASWEPASLQTQGRGAGAGSSLEGGAPAHHQLQEGEQSAAELRIVHTRNAAAPIAPVV